MYTKLDESIKAKLRKIFGDRVCFDPLELSAYSKDLIKLPSKLQGYVQNTPEAVVQPESKEELQQLMEIATMEKVPITPRGAGTSAFGGAIPTAGGIVVDMVRYRGIDKLDKENQTVTVLAGTTLLQIEEDLLFRGFSLKIYPSSAPSATIGGWASQGGCGYGSYANQDVGQIIDKAQVLLPNGSTTILEGEGLKKIIGTFGTSGIITEITLKVGERLKA